MDHNFTRSVKKPFEKKKGVWHNAERKGLKEGLQKRLQKGIQKGKNKGLPKAIESVSGIKFGTVDPSVEKAFRKINFPEKLEELLHWAKIAKSLQALGSCFTCFSDEDFFNTIRIFPAIFEKPLPAPAMF